MNLLILCTLSPGLDAIKFVVEKCDWKVTIVGLQPSTIDNDQASGIIDITSFCKDNGLDCILLSSYKITSDSDRAKVLKAKPDIIWVAAWQRLIPEWLIKSPRLGVVGTHGGPDGITLSRGRSPQNWTMMLGINTFSLSLFKIKPGVDDGPIISEGKFYYTDEDDIKISYYKAAITTSRLVLDVLRDPNLLDNATDQLGEPAYFPQRLPEDGVIDWQQTCAHNIRQIRALSHPYPGAFTTLSNTELKIWRVVYFDDNKDEPPGTISYTFVGGEFLVCCIDGRILVREWSSIDCDLVPQLGDQFNSISFDLTMKNIMNRHVENYKHQKLNKRFTKWLP